MKNALTDIQQRLATIAKQQQDLLMRFSAALGAGNTAEQGIIQKQLTRLMAEMERLGDEQRYAQKAELASQSRPRARAPGKTMREQVLDVLDEIGVPLSPSTISEFIETMTGVDIPPSRFASLRRDEERSATRDFGARPAWIAPALSASHLNAIPRLLTSSAWELDRRLVGARSLRVNHLYITLAFIQRYERLKAANAPQTHSFESLVVRYARGIPGAVSAGAAVDTGEIRKVTLAELEIIKEDDKAERVAAAARLTRFSGQQRLWGLPSVIEGGSREGRAG